MHWYYIIIAVSTLFDVFVVRMFVASCKLHVTDVQGLHAYYVENCAVQILLQLRFIANR